jgi:hypothetical protein
LNEQSDVHRCIAQACKGDGLWRLVLLVSLHPVASRLLRSLIHRLILRVQHSILLSLMDVHLGKIVVHEIVKHRDLLLDWMESSEFGLVDLDENGRQDED